MFTHKQWMKNKRAKFHGTKSLNLVNRLLKLNSNYQNLLLIREKNENSLPQKTSSYLACCFVFFAVSLFPRLGNNFRFAVCVISKTKILLNYLVALHFNRNCQTMNQTFRSDISIPFVNETTKYQNIRIYYSYLNSDLKCSKLEG